MKFSHWKPSITLIPLWLFLLFFHSSPWARESELGPRKDLFKVDQIEFQGLKRVEREAVLGKIGVKQGMVLDNYLLLKDIEKIYSLKYFEYVSASRKKSKGKNVLVFSVKEKPVITAVIFEGNDEIDEDDLKSHIKTKNFDILDENTLKSDVLSIQKHYEEKGFFLASVNYEVVEDTKDSRTVTFKIQEFEKVRVKEVTFLGNTAFKDNELKSIMETREDGTFAFMTGAGNFKELNFQTDVERIKYFYKTKGYLQANVSAPQITISEDRRWVFITLKVNEGPQFTVRNISFQGELLFPEEELRKDISLKSEKTYSEESLRLDIQKLTEKYQDEGYAFANVLRNLRIVPGANEVDVEFSFEKGKIAYFGKITVKGNTKTRDKVIRRELRIREGARFSGSALRESRENVNRLGFFEPNSVVFNTITPKGKDDVLDVEINLKERNTGQISLGAGYSTATGGFFQGSVSQRNFRGLGQDLTLSLSWSNTDQKLNLGFTEPYLFDTKWTAGGDIFYTQNDRSDSFSFKKKGFDVRVGYPIFDYTRLFVTYKFEDTTIKAVNDPTINEDLENGVASSVRTTLLRDKRNNTFEPTKGHYVSLSTEYAGIGGEKKWWKNELDARYYYRVWGDLIFRSRVFAANLQRVDSRDIPRSEKFQLGGSRNLRGYNFEDVGPKRTAEVSGRQVTFNSRSDSMAFTSLEFEHPLAREAGLKWVVFFDAGDATDFDQFKPYMDYGFGFRWFSPIGVLRFEFGYPINPDEDQEGSQFHFDIGQLF